MTLSFAVSKVVRLLLKPWAVDTRSSSVPRRTDRFAGAAERPLYARNGTRVSVSRGHPRDHD